MRFMAFPSSNVKVPENYEHMHEAPSLIICPGNHLIIYVCITCSVYNVHLYACIYAFDDC